VVAGDHAGAAAAHQLHAFVGVGVVAHHVAEADDALRAALVERGERRGERLAVAVDVA
jgi:hypothetical protein